MNIITVFFQYMSILHFGILDLKNRQFYHLKYLIHFRIIYEIINSATSECVCVFFFPSLNFISYTHT